MISKEQTTMIQILSDFLNKRKSDIGNDLLFGKLTELAKSQQTEGIVYYQLKDIAEPSEIAVLQKGYAFSLFVYKNRTAILQKIENALNEAKIQFFIFKGSEIAKYYSFPALRTMGDSDILVHPEDREKAHGLFEQLGLKRTESGPNEWIYDYNGLEFELHIRLMNEGEVGNYDSHKAFMYRHWDYATAEPDSCHYHLDISYHFVFLLLHLRKHFINSGVGFRQFMDLAVVIQHCDLDWAFIKDELTKMDLLGFAEICLGLCNKWFGVKSPLMTEVDCIFADETAERIFMGGVFGFDDAENKENYRILEINKSGNTKTSRLKMTLHNLFPDYKTLKAVRKYSFIDGKPYLLPIAWVYRFFRSIFQGRVVKKLPNGLKPMVISKEQVNARIEYLKKWKLL